MILAAALASAYGPGGHNRAMRASSLASCAALNTLVAQRPAIEASSHGTMTLCGGRPSTDNTISPGAACASAAVIAITADRSASGAEPNRRNRDSPASLTPFSTIDACFDPAQTMKAF
jgi:hypothetical protein